jgi:hypothetical protein
MNKDMHLLQINSSAQLIAVVRPARGTWQFETMQNQRSEFLEGFGFKDVKLAMHFAENVVKSLGLV